MNTKNAEKSAIRVSNNMVQLLCKLQLQSTIYKMYHLTLTDTCPSRILVQVQVW